mgnify:CR=1 FL=1
MSAQRKHLIIRRRKSVRNVGVAEVAAALNVSKQAVTNYVNGCTSALRPEYRNRIQIINED